MSSFYDRPEDERIALTEQAILMGNSVTERWTVLTDREARSWNGRAALAARWLMDSPSVIDMGCGTMNLERHLMPEQAYIPVDIVARDARTILCDFNHEQPPGTDARAIACLGLLEYLHQPFEFLATLAERYPVGVLSYCIHAGAAPLEKRRANAWVNDLTAAQIEAMIRQAGWTIIESRDLGRVQRLWRLTSSVREGRSLLTSP